MKETLVSIVMPAYQAEQTIDKAINGIRAQSYDQWELWVIVDAATDRTAAMVLAHAAEDARIHACVSTKNRGVTRSRNLGIRLAKGTHLAFCDADDWWSHDKLEKQLLWMAEKKANFCYTSAYYVQMEANWTSAPAKMPATLNLARLKQGNPIGLSTAVYELNTLGKHYFEAMPAGLVHEDYAYWVRIFRATQVTAVLLPAATTWVRIYANSRSANKWVALQSQAYVLRDIAGCSLFMTAVYVCTYLLHALKKRGWRTWYQQLKPATVSIFIYLSHSALNHV